MANLLQKDTMTKYKDPKYKNVKHILNEVPVLELVHSADIIFHFDSTMFIDAMMMEKTNH